MPQKPRISPTKISLYLACPVKFRWTYIDGRGRWYLRAKSYYSFGASLHRVLERFHDSGDNGVETAGQLAGALEESWIDAGFRSAEEMSEAFGEGLDLLERHVAQTRERAPGVKTLFVEKELRLDMGEFVLLGRLDRVDEHPDGSLEIVDYKTGRDSVSEEDVANDIAMGVYQLLLYDRFPDRSIRATILAIKTGDSATAAFTPEARDDFRKIVLQIGRQIVQEDFFERRPVPKPLCERCDFLPLCRQDPSY